VVVVQCNRSKSLVIIALLRRRRRFRVQDVAVNRLKFFTVSINIVTVVKEHTASNIAILFHSSKRSSTIADDGADDK